MLAEEQFYYIQFYKGVIMQVPTDRAGGLVPVDPAVGEGKSMSGSTLRVAIPLDDEPDLVVITSPKHEAGVKSQGNTLEKMSTCAKAIRNFLSRAASSAATWIGNTRIVKVIVNLLANLQKTHGRSSVDPDEDPPLPHETQVAAAVANRAQQTFNLRPEQGAPVDSDMIDFDEYPVEKPSGLLGTDGAKQAHLLAIQRQEAAAKTEKKQDKTARVQSDLAGIAEDLGPAVKGVAARGGPSLADLDEQAKKLEGWQGQFEKKPNRTE